MRPLSRFLRLPSGERRLLTEAVLLLLLIQVSLKRVPFAMLRRLLVRSHAGSGRSPEADQLVVDQAVWAVTAASQRLSRWTTCLTRGLTLQAMLARRGCRARLHVGVGRGVQGELEGHAWVEREGRVLIGGPAVEVARFSRLATFEVEAVSPPSVPVLQGGR
jgi:hypothetical protein